MCKTYNTIGSLTSLKKHLEENNIHDFKSLKEVINFQKSYSFLRQKLISDYEIFIENEKNILNENLPILEELIKNQRQQSELRFKSAIANLHQELNILTNYSSKNIFHRVISSLKKWNYKRKIRLRECSFENDVNKSIAELVNDYQIKQNRYQFITSNFEEAVKQSAYNQLFEIERKKRIIDNLNNYIYGAIGEQKVVKTLEKLSDEYFLINDFSVSFSKPIYNRRENDYIKSVQIDHILVGPSGVFIIETKNWSEKSLENFSLRSPVEQIRRSSFALFALLNNENSNFSLRLNSHHWGVKKIPLKNLIVLTNTRPIEEFQYVKILTVDELIGYVNYFKPIFSPSETKKITEMILEINDKMRLN